MKVNVVSGFLGAGKTTLIKKLLEEGVFPEKVVVLENEYGEVGIDGPLLSGESIQVKELYSGCICCTLVGDFVAALEELAQGFQAGRVIIEPSGVARLSETKVALDRAATRCPLQVDTLMAVVDVLNFSSFAANFGEFYLDQVIHGEGIILSRTGKAGPGLVKKVVDNIRLLNPGAGMVTLPWEGVAGEEIVSTARQGAGRARMVDLLDRMLGEGPHARYPLPPAGDLFEAWGLETDKKYRRQELEEIVGQLPREEKYGRVLRAKGLVSLQDGSWARFDYVPGEKKVEAFSPGDKGRIAVIGRKLDRKNLERLFS